MEADQIGVVLERASELHAKISDAIERAVKSDFVHSPSARSPLTVSYSNRSGILHAISGSPYAEDEAPQPARYHRRTGSLGYEVEGRTYGREKGQGRSESKQLIAVRDALEMLEEHLERLQMGQDDEERAAVLEELDAARRVLVQCLKQHQGRELEVIREALEFAGEPSEEESRSLSLPHYPLPPRATSPAHPTSSSLHDSREFFSRSVNLSGSYTREDVTGVDRREISSMSHKLEALSNHSHLPHPLAYSQSGPTTRRTYGGEGKFRRGGSEGDAPWARGRQARDYKEVSVRSSDGGKYEPSWDPEGPDRHVGVIRGRESELYRSWCEERVREGAGTPGGNRVAYRPRIRGNPMRVMVSPPQGSPDGSAALEADQVDEKEAGQLAQAIEGEGKRDAVPTMEREVDKSAKDMPPSPAEGIKSHGSHPFGLLKTASAVLGTLVVAGLGAAVGARSQNRVPAQKRMTKTGGAATSRGTWAAPRPPTNFPSAVVRETERSVPSSNKKEARIPDVLYGRG